MTSYQALTFTLLLSKLKPKSFSIRRGKFLFSNFRCWWSLWSKFCSWIGTASWPKILRFVDKIFSRTDGGNVRLNYVLQKKNWKFIVLISFSNILTKYLVSKSDSNLTRNWLKVTQSWLSVTQNWLKVTHNLRRSYRIFFRSDTPTWCIIWIFSSNR